MNDTAIDPGQAGTQSCAPAKALIFRAIGLGLGLAMIVAAGCRSHCGSAHMHRLPSTCVGYPETMYYGYYPTCWRRWPEGWGCPEETIIETVPAGEESSESPTPAEDGAGMTPQDAEPPEPTELPAEGLDAPALDDQPDGEAPSGETAEETLDSTFIAPPAEVEPVVGISEQSDAGGVEEVSNNQVANDRSDASQARRSSDASRLTLGRGPRQRKGSGTYRKF